MDGQRQHALSEILAGKRVECRYCSQVLVEAWLLELGSTRRRSSPPNRVADDILPLSNPRHSAP